ncbi:MAG: trigger factor [Rhodospirillaceae bacterium]|nr:trigger factor [Rhodospirillaceae bacterium]
MQVTETKTEGLLHEFTIAVPANEIEKTVNSRLDEISKTARLPGFRPGKVPAALLRKQYGPSIMGEVLERTVGETSEKALAERDLRPAMQPKIEVIKFEEGSDLEYTMAIEVMPKITPMDFSKINLERLVVKADEEEVSKTLDRLASAHKTSKLIESDRKAKLGDVVVIGFIGKVGGEEFPGGKAEGYELELGSGSFIPGFEDQLIGVKAGDKVEVKVSFPEEYGGADLAGKDAVFDVTVRELKETTPATIDDDLAKKVGIDDLDTLKKNIREEHEREFKEMSRQRLKRLLLDQLEENHDFVVPQGLMDRESEAIWTQFEEHRKHAKEHGHDEDPSEGKSDDELKTEFNDIAERRVRLGLLLAEIGTQNNLQISQEDLNRAMMAEAQKYPGQEQEVLEYFRKNPEALQSLSGPLMEDKVVDFILELAKVSDKKVSPEELMKPLEEPKKKPAKKKAAAKKPAAKKKAAKKSD